MYKTFTTRILHMYYKYMNYKSNTPKSTTHVSHMQYTCGTCDSV